MSGTLTRMTGGGGASNDSALNTGQGLLSQTYNRNVAVNQSTPGQGTAHLTSLGLVAGQTVANLAIQIITAGAGTAPTSVTMALLDKTGKVLALTGELKNDAQLLATTEKRFALASPYVVTVTDGYYVGFLQVGPWGTTAMQLARGISNAAYTTAFTGGIHATALGGTGLSNFPAVNSSVTVAAAGGVGYWHGAS